MAGTRALDRYANPEAARTLSRASLDAASPLGLGPLATCIRQRLDDPANRAHP